MCIRDRDVSRRYPIKSLSKPKSYGYTEIRDREKSRKYSCCRLSSFSEQQLSEIKQEAAKDPTLQIFKNMILRGWPENSSSVPKEVSEYFNVRDELAVQDGIIFKGQRCVIPKALRQKVKEKIQGCLRRARGVVYWPFINQEIPD